MISNPVHGEVYSIQHYVITFISDLGQVGGFLWVLRFPPLIKLATTIVYNWNIVEVALNTINQTKPKPCYNLCNVWAFQWFEHIHLFQWRKMWESRCDVLSVVQTWVWHNQVADLFKLLMIMSVLFIPCTELEFTVNSFKYM